MKKYARRRREKKNRRGKGSRCEQADKEKANQNAAAASTVLAPRKPGSLGVILSPIGCSLTRTCSIKIIARYIRSRQPTANKRRARAKPWR